MADLGNLYSKDRKAVLKHREWRGFKDTMYDYYRWLVTWKDMIVMVLKAPISTVRGLWNKDFRGQPLFFACLSFWIFFISRLSTKA